MISRQHAYLRQRCLLIQSIDFAREDRAGEHGVSAKVYEDALKRSADALASLRKMHADKTLRLLQLPAEQSDLAAITDAARKLARARPISSSSAPAARALAGRHWRSLPITRCPVSARLRAPPRMHFMDNLDPQTFGGFLSKLPLATTRFVCVSKSGGTGETLMQTIAALSAVKAAKLDARIPEIFFGLTEPAKSGKRNGLRELLAAHKVAMLDHDTGVGGRYSALTNVGLASGGGARSRHRGDPRGRGARRSRRCWPANLPPMCRRLSARRLSIALAESKGKTISVMMAYADRLEKFVKWYVQLWAESLGKDGKGTTPVGALGPVDQHSQLQLFIAGPRDKLFTVITTGNGREGPAHRRRAGQARGRRGIWRQDHRRSRRRAGPRHHRNAGARTDARCAAFTSRRSMRSRSVNC